VKIHSEKDSFHQTPPLDPCRTVSASVPTSPVVAPASCHQKPRSALFAPRLRDCGRGNSPEAAPKQSAAEKGKCTASVHSVEVNARRRPARIGGVKTSLPKRAVVVAAYIPSSCSCDNSGPNEFESFQHRLD
jgi:hypothetical protein